MKEIFEIVFDNYVKDFKTNIDKKLPAIKAIMDDAPAKLIETKLFNNKNNNLDKEKYEIKGSCGQGNTSPLPWIAIFRKTETESAQRGIYIVYLFNTNCDKVYLTLNQGSTAIEHIYKKETSELLVQNACFWRKKLSLYNKDYFIGNNDIVLYNSSDKQTAQSTGQAYQDGTIYYKVYEKNKLPSNKEIIDDLEKMLDLYEKYVDCRLHLFNEEEEKIPDNDSTKVYFQLSSNKKSFNLKNFTTPYAERYVKSLLAKRFVILTGNSGTGKTNIAKNFAKWLEKKDDKGNTNYLVKAVGSDWTDNTKVLGYLNPIANNGKGDYVSTDILNLIIDANNNPEIPFFLILDEMNLSHVERYFSDFLSAMESKEEIILYKKAEGCSSTIDERISIPDNLFITGTVNIDETTYMFSPKVLDRANVIEFIPDPNDVLKNFKEDSSPDIHKPVDDGSAEGFLVLAKQIRDSSNLPNDGAITGKLLKGLSEILIDTGFEFAYRTTKEIRLYLNAATELAKNENKTLTEKDYIDLMDEQLVQKILPKIHGNRSQIGILLQNLYSFCDEKVIKLNEDTEIQGYPLPLSKAKIARMQKQLETSQFASFI